LENGRLVEIKNNFKEKQYRKYCKEVKGIKAGFQSRVNCCTDKEEKLIAGRRKITEMGKIFHRSFE
jgi:hypothetical protein